MMKNRIILLVVFIMFSATSLTSGPWIKEGPKRPPWSTRVMSIEEKLQLQHERSEEEKEHCGEDKRIESEWFAQSCDWQYFPATVTQYLYYKGHHGSTIELGDGTIWCVRKKDAKKVAYWQAKDDDEWGMQRGDELYITTNTNWFFSKNYDYKIVNVDKNEDALVNFSQPPYQGEAPYIQTIDYTFGRIALSDGSCWDLSDWDRKVYQMWEPLDPIVIGINNRWNSSTKPFILINTETGAYSRAKLLN